MTITHKFPSQGPTLHKDQNDLVALQNGDLAALQHEDLAALRHEDLAALQHEDLVALREADLAERETDVGPIKLNYSSSEAHNQ